MSRVGTVNFSEQVDGDTFLVKEFRFWQELDVTPLDLTDVTVRAQIRKGSYLGKLVKTATVGDGITWINQSEGKFQLGGFNIDWGGAGDYYYDVEFLYNTSSITRTYVRGKIEVIKQATR